MMHRPRLKTIKDQPYHKITVESINPYHGSNLAGTIYIMGSPGAGKSRFLERAEQETGGKLVLESGVFDLFQNYLKKWIKDKTEMDGKRPIMMGDDFYMPNIDGLNIMENMMDLGNDETTWPGAPYKGIGAGCYREYLDPSIIGGGKSGYPDWLFIPDNKGNYYQMISIPGHFTLEKTKNNRSIPDLSPPDSVVYLIDPGIIDFWVEYNGNPALENCSKHLEDVIRFEKQGIPVHWYLSKTKKDELPTVRTQAISIYSSDRSTNLGNAAIYQIGQLDNLKEITLRIPKMDGFETYTSPSRDFITILENAGIDLSTGNYRF